MCSLLDHTHQLAVTAHEPDAPGQGAHFVVATRSRTRTGSVRSRAKQAICESISYHDTILGRIWEDGGAGVAFAVQPHREVKPES